MKRNETERTARDWSQLDLGVGGWVEVHLDDRIGLVHFAEWPDGRLRADQGYLAAPDGVLDVGAWRAFPLAALETAVNVPEVRDQILATIATPTKLELHDLDHQAVAFRSTVRRRRRIAAISLRLKIPTARRYPDDFYEKVAALYLGLVERNQDQAPAETIVEANDVPVTTVHRWVREARQRGLLAPARAAGRPG